MIGLSRFDRAAQRVLVEARRRTRLSARTTISSRQLLAGCLADEAVRTLFDASGVPTEAVLARVDDSYRRTELLDAIGIDIRTVERRTPPGGPTTGLALRRSVIRPLRITLGHPPAATPFAGSGRKVLEVALWNARRHRSEVSPHDLLFGILADSDDPAYRAIADSAQDGLRRLIEAL